MKTASKNTIYKTETILNNKKQYNKQNKIKRQIKPKGICCTDSADLMMRGRQSVGAKTVKARSPFVLSLDRGTFKGYWSADLSNLGGECWLISSEI